jgi:hypothetical protein
MGRARGESREKSDRQMRSGKRGERTHRIARRFHLNPAADRDQKCDGRSRMAVFFARYSAREEHRLLFEIKGKFADGPLEEGVEHLHAGP